MEEMNMKFFFLSFLVIFVNSSVYHEKVLLYSITEEIPSDSFIADLALDSRLSVKYPATVRSKLTFVFLKEIENLELFSLDERNGILRTGRVIDRDVICPGQLDCTIRIDLAVQPSAYFEVIKVEISILDINDNSPKFDQERFHVTIVENSLPGERFPLPAATDLDSSPNGIAEYRLVTFTNYFQLDVKNDSAGKPKEIFLRLFQELDREKHDRFELVITAFDGGLPRRSAILTLDIEIGDINDNNPKFDRTMYNVSVSENTSIGTTIARLLAVDADVGANGHVRYQFSQRSAANYADLFAIDPENGDIVLLQTLNHAQQNVYNLGVIAEDQGEYSVPALAALVINVVDINDHAPQIIIDALSATGSVEVLENSDVGTFVAHVSTFDRDNGDNGLVRCSINNNNNFRLIQIYDGEYKIVTIKVFDREAIDRYEIVIKCHDNGEPRLYVNRVMTINVADVNDNHPVFTHAIYNNTLQENVPWGSFVVRVSAHDPDDGVNGEIAYMLDADAGDRYHVDPDTGVVSTLAALDRESSDVVEFHVLAINKGEHGLMSRAKVNIRVIDVDDEPPQFINKRYVFDVFENQPARTEVGRVTAFDRDLSPFNAFSFVVHDSKIFGVDSKSGIMFTKKSLDREAEDQYKLTVEVLSSTVIIKRDNATVIINVLDENDNSPYVTFPNEVNNSVDIPSTFAIFEVVAVVKGNDDDIGINSELFYEIWEGNATGFFSVDPNSGQVRLLKDLSDHVNKTFQMIVKVEDCGKPKLHCFNSLFINVVEDAFLIFPSIPAAAADGLWSWFIDRKLVIIASVTSICFIFVIVLLVAIFVVRKKNSRLRSTHHLAKIEMMKMDSLNDDDDDGGGGGETKEVDDDDDDDDADTIKRMKIMMNDGKMVRMEEISYTELNPDFTCNVIHHCHANNDSSSSSNRRKNVNGNGIGQRVNVVSATFDADADSGCADVSHCNDDVSSGSERSSKDAESVLPGNNQFLPSSSDGKTMCRPSSSSDGKTMCRPSSSSDGKTTCRPSSSSDHHTSKLQKKIKILKSENKNLNVKMDVAPPPVSSSSSSSSSSSASFPLLPASSSATPPLPNINRKSVHFADDHLKKEKVDSCDSERKKADDDGSSAPPNPPATGKVTTYIHQYPSRVAMTTFLPEDGSLV